MRSGRYHSSVVLGLLAVCAAAPPGWAGGPTAGPARIDSLGDPLPPHALARFGTTRWRQQWSVVQLSYSRDGKLLAAMSYEEGFCLWEAASGKRLSHLPVEDSYRRPSAISGDCRLLALADKERTAVRLYDAMTGKERGVLPAGRVALVALSPDGGLLATLSWGSRGLERRVCLWDTAKGALLWQIRCATSALAFSADGKALLTGNDKRLRVWDVATGKELRRIDGPAAEFALSADGRTLVTRQKHDVRVIDFATGAERRTVPTPDDELDTRYDKVALSADGTTVALAGSGFLFAWDVHTGKERWRRTGESHVTALTFAATGHRLTWGCMYDPVIHRLDLVAGKEMQPCPGHESWVQSVAFAPDGQTLVSGSTDRTVRFWGLDHAGAGDGNPLLPTGESRSHSLILGGRVAYSPDGKLLAVLGPDANVNLIDVATRKVVRTLTGSTGCCCLAFSPDGRLVAGGDSYYGRSSNPQGRVYLWEVATGKLTRFIDGHGGIVRAVAFAPDGRTIASGSDGVRLWDVSSGGQVRRFKHGRFVETLAFTPDGKTLASGGEEAVLWDTATGQELHHLAGAGQVPALVISPDGKLVATGGLDKTVRLWELATGTELVQLPGHTGRVHAVAFSSDSKQMASGGEDTTILLWDVGAALDAARRKAGKAPEPANLEALWADLAGADAAAGHKVVWALVAEPDRAIAFLEKRLHPSREEDDGDLPVPPGEPLRRVRAVQVLERIGTAQARALLGKLSRGEPSRTSRESKAALLRLDRLQAAPADPRPEPTRAERLEQRWKELGEADAAAGHEAVWALVGEPGQAVALLGARLRPAAVEEADPGPAVGLPAGDALRALRAIMVLERIGTPEARQVLEALGKGAPARITQEARAALERLDRRTRDRP